MFQLQCTRSTKRTVRYRMVSRATPSPLAVALQARPPVAVCRILLHKLRACVTQPVSTSLITFYRFSAVPPARRDSILVFFFFLFFLRRRWGNFEIDTVNFFSRKSARSILDLASGRRRIDRWCTRGFRGGRSVARVGGWGDTLVELWLAKNLYHAKHRSDL